MPASPMLRQQNNGASLTTIVLRTIVRILDKPSTGARVLTDEDVEADQNFRGRLPIYVDRIQADAVSIQVEPLGVC